MPFLLDFDLTQSDTRRIGWWDERSGRCACDLKIGYYKAANVRLQKATRPRGSDFRISKSRLGLVISLAFVVLPCFSQSPPASEISKTKSEPNYKLQVERNLVQVRVVVRNAKGVPVDNLQKEDFLLYDRGKLQTITHFSVDRPEMEAAQAAKVQAKESEPDIHRDAELKSASPQRYLALYFDDVRMPFEDIALVRKAAGDYLTTALTPGDRVGIYTSSGQGNLDFTADRDAMEEALRRLQPRPLHPQATNPCPNLLDYQAYLMTSSSDPYAREIATQEDLFCRFQGDDRFLKQAAGDAQTEAERKLNEFQASSEFSLRGLNELIRRLSLVPGQRSLVLVSTGFLTLGMENRVDQIADQALRENVIVSTLDSRGLSVESPESDVSEGRFPIASLPGLNAQKMQIRIEEQRRIKEVLSTLATDTGGFHFQGSNDLREGFRRASGLPSVYYTLAFSPSQMKLDGKFHRLTVKLSGSNSYLVEAREGYYAPQQSAKPEDRAKEEIAKAVFSSDDVSQIPIELQTQFFKQNESDARLSILARLDLRYLQFRKQEGRNLNVLTVVTVLFDQNGNYVQGKEKRLDLNLLDSSLSDVERSGITMRTSFDVKPGTYMVREVVRDSEGSQLSGLTRTVDIPF
jgi:VWFA-related protein